MLKSSPVGSYQFDCFVASLLTSSTAERLASYCVVPSTLVELGFWSAVDALRVFPVVFLRLTTLPSSSYASEPEDASESERGGGGATLRGAAFVARFLNLTTGASIVFLSGEGNERRKRWRRGRAV